MSAIEACRTEVHGGHVAACCKCNHQHIACDSCKNRPKNRHCPKCQGPVARNGMAARAEDLLPVEYFHVVFTLPAEIARIAYWNRKTVYAHAIQETRFTIARWHRDTVSPDPILSGWFQVQVCQCSYILGNHVFLSVLAINVGEYPELFHPPDAMPDADAQLGMPCIVVFILLAQGAFFWIPFVVFPEKFPSNRDRPKPVHLKACLHGPRHRYACHVCARPGRVQRPECACCCR